MLNGCIMPETDAETTPLPIRLALYQPDIPQNLGTLLRLGACLNVPVEVIEPCGFVLDDRKLRRAGMDYMADAAMRRWQNWPSFHDTMQEKNLCIILLTTKATEPFHQFSFRAGDVLLLGRESAGVPEAVANACNARITIPMTPKMRSLNIATAASLVLSEALRQTDRWNSLWQDRH